MNLLWFILKESWVKVVIATLAASLGGALNALLLNYINDAINNSMKSKLLIFGFIGLVVLSSITNLASSFLLIIISQNSIYRLRLRMSRWILASPLRHLEELGPQRLLATLTDDTSSIATAVSNIPSLCSNITLLFGCLIYLFKLSWIVFCGVFLFLILAFLIVKYLLDYANKFMRLARDKGDQLFNHYRAITDGIKELKLNFKRRDAFLRQDLKVTAKASRNYRIGTLQLLEFASSTGQVFFLLFLDLFYLYSHN
jgi:putative pyoverdin transport system ATP-binding/permease protein